MTKKLRADLVLLLLTAFWGVSFPLIRNVLDQMPALPYLSIRFFIAAVLVSIIFFNKHKYIKKNEIKGGLVIGGLLFAGMFFQVFGLYDTTASNSAFITSMSVAFVPLFLAIFFKDKTKFLTITGIIIACVGLFLISGIGKININPGDVLTLLCAVAFAFQIIFIGKFSRNSNRIGVSIVQLWTAAILTTSIWLIFDRSKIVINFETIIVLFVTAVLGTAVAYTAQILVQKDTKTSHAALIFTMEPMFAMVFTFLIPDSGGNIETMGIIKIIGCALILFGTLISEYKTIFGKEK